MKHLRLAIRSCSGLLLAGAILLQVTFLPAQAPSTSSGQAIPIAVVEFEGNGISQTEAIALTDRLRNELFRLGVFEVVERGMMETILTEQDFQLTGCTSNECLVEVGQLLGARQVVGGRISRVGAMFTVSARVVDVQTGKLLGVSDFDLRGGLEEMLTDGMKQVAVMLSAYGVVIKEEAPAVAVAAEEPSAEVDVPVGEVVEIAPAEESEVMVDIPMEEAAETTPIEEPEVQVDLAMEEAAPAQQPTSMLPIGSGHAKTTAALGLNGFDMALSIDFGQPSPQKKNMQYGMMIGMILSWYYDYNDPWPPRSPFINDKIDEHTTFETYDGDYATVEDLEEFEADGTLF